MGTVEVINKRNHSKGGVYIGRPGIFGNPFRIGPDGDRAEVIEKYRQWLSVELGRNQELREALEDLVQRVSRGEDLQLVCWCAPQPCHGDVLAELIRERIKG